MEDRGAARRGPSLSGRDRGKGPPDERLQPKGRRATFGQRPSQGRSRRRHPDARAGGLNKLKAINDRYGHQAGDRCLRHVANTFLGNVRECDWVARWGGDEFVVVLWEEKGDSKANLVLDRITEELAENPVELPQGDMLRLTYSAGVVRCTTKEDAELGSG